MHMYTSCHARCARVKNRPGENVIRKSNVRGFERNGWWKPGTSDSIVFSETKFCCSRRIAVRAVVVSSMALVRRLASVSVRALETAVGGHPRKDGGR